MVHVGWTGLEQQRAVNVEGTRTVARAARQVGARMVHVSTTDTCGFGTLDNPADEETPIEGGVHCPYVVTKREAEQVVRELVADGLDAVIVNPSYMLGPWDWKPSSGKMLLQVAGGWALVAPRGHNNFCDVRDVARGVLLARDRGQAGRRYILGGESLSYLDAWRLFAEVAGARGPLGQAKRRPLAMLAAGRLGDLRTKLTGREGAVNSAAVAMSRLSKCCTHARAEAELGYQPGPTRAAAEAAWDWFRQYGYIR
jgi:dihydroflavonol-4-reductase